MKVLELRNVRRTYGSQHTSVHALDDLSLDVHDGEFVALRGPSGSGKSTLLNLAGGLDHPTGGTVRLRGTDLGTLSPAGLADIRLRHVGYIFQRYNLVPSLTALENVMLPLEFGGTRTRTAREVAAAALGRVGLAPPYDRYPEDLSGGEQQRVSIARAVAGRRSIILADEPTGALDTTGGDRIVELLTDLASEGTAVLLVTHEPRLASWAQRVVFLRDGRIVNETDAASPNPAAEAQLAR
jgi:putative ABC transport system ATP-binding protein